MAFMHKEMAAGRWREYSLVEQMANIGSEVYRAINRHKKGEREHFINAFDRAIELFDLTLQDPRWNGRKKEIARSREVFCDLFFGGNRYNTDPDSLNRYFMQYAIAARVSAMKKREC